MSDTDPDWYANYRREVEAAHAKAVALLEWMRKNTPQFDLESSSHRNWLKRATVHDAIRAGVYDRIAPHDGWYGGRKVPAELL